MASYISGTGVYADEKLVVELPYMGRVRELVTKFGGDDGVVDDGEQSLALNLTRFTLPGLPGMHSTLSRLVEQAKGLPSRLLDQFRPPDPEASDLDRLLFLLRVEFAANNSGWTLRMGKDRDMEAVTGLPHLSGGGGLTFPEVASAKDYATVEDVRLGRGVRVGVIDTRLFRDPERPDFPLPERQLDIDSGSWLEERDAYPHWAGHGTFVTGLIAAQAPSVTVVYRGVLSDEHARATSWDVAHQIVAMRDKDIQILNLSLGLVTEDGQEPLVLSQALRQLGAGIVVVAAAGNHGGGDPDDPSDRWPRLTVSDAAYPAAHDGVVAVGALDGAEPAGFTPKVSWIRFYAQGARQVSTYLTGPVEIRRSAKTNPLVFDASVPDDETVEEHFSGYAAWAGTSMAAAVVSGRLAALTRYTGRDPADALELLAKERPNGNALSVSGPENPEPGLVSPVEDSLSADRSLRNHES